MLTANVLNWTVGGLFMRSMGVLVRIPKRYMLPVVLLVTLTSIYVQEMRMEAMIFAIGLGYPGFVMRRLVMSPLPFVIAFILGGTLEENARQAFAATGGDPFFLLTNPIALAFIVLAFFVVVRSSRSRSKNRDQT